MLKGFTTNFLRVLIFSYTFLKEAVKDTGCSVIYTKPLLAL